jgi:hypothetical protein
MKRKTTYFLAGVLVVVLLLAMSVTVLASDGSLTITIHPIRVIVNGEVFQPKDVSGQDVMVFTVNGTTYAPLRALAEAYGLEVGYDSATNTATVNKPGPAPAPAVPVTSSNDFYSKWTVVEKPVTNYGDEKVFTATYNGGLSMRDFKTWWKSFDPDEIASVAEEIAAESQSLNPGYKVTMYFSYGTYMLGTAYAFGGFEQSNFTPSTVWIS